MTRTDPDPIFAAAVLEEITTEIRAQRGSRLRVHAPGTHSQWPLLLTVAATAVVLALVAVVAFGLTHALRPAPADSNVASLGTTSSPAAVACGAETGFAPFHCNTYVSVVAADHDKQRAWETKKPLRMTFRYVGKIPTLKITTTCSTLQVPVTVSSTHLVATSSHVLTSGADCTAPEQAWMISMLKAPITYSQSGAVINFAQGTMRLFLKAIGSVLPPTGTAAEWDPSLAAPAVTHHSTNAPLPACTLNQLTIWAQPEGGGAMSTYYQDVFVRNDGADCSLQHAGVEIVVGANRAHAALAQETNLLPDLPTGTSEALRIDLPELCPQDPAGAGAASGTKEQRLHLRVGGVERTLKATIPWGSTCTQLGFGSAGFAGSADFTGKDGYDNALPELSVSISTPELDTHTGSSLDYRVTITNNGTTTYEPTTCPSFTQVVSTSTSVTTQRGTLNCHAVTGIPPHGRRAFNMTIPTPTPGSLALGWFLNDAGGASTQA